MLLPLRQRVPSLWGCLQDVSVPRPERLLLSGVVVLAVAGPAHTTLELVGPHSYSQLWWSAVESSIRIQLGRWGEGGGGCGRWREVEGGEGGLGGVEGEEGG